MSSSAHAQMVDIFLKACDLEDDRLNTFLAEACGGDTLLRADVERLLRHDRTRAPIDQPVIDFAESGADGPKRIGPYEIAEVLGVGGMGMVYKARQSNPSRLVALKVLRPGMASRALIRRFQQEAHLLGQLADPGIAQIYEAGTADSGNGPQPFFAMEYVEGMSLTEHAKRQKLGPLARLDLLARICESVHHAHQKGIVHRDLKPANILVTANGIPKILDFGVARATDSDIRSTTMQTEAGQLIGTLPYMSPEQVAGDPESLDTRSDVYALGVIGYELLAGHLPHDLSNRSVPDAVRLIQDESPTRLSSFDRFYRGDIETIVAKAMDKDKDRRYPSAQALADDIRRYLSFEPITARPASAMYQFKKFAKRNRAVVWAAAIIAATLVIATGVSVTYAVQATRAEGVAKAERNNARDAATFAEEKRQEAENALAAAQAARDAEAEQRVEAQRQAKIANAVNEFLNKDLLEAVDPSRTADRDITVREVLDAASDTIDERFAGEPIIQIAIHDTVGTTYRRLGVFEKAEHHLKEALRLLEETLGREHQDTGFAINNLGVLYNDQQKYQDALPLLEEALEINIKHGGEMEPRTPRTMGNIATALSGLGRYDEALEMSQKALALKRKIYGKKHIETTKTIGVLANALATLGRFDEAVPLFREGLEINRELVGEDHPDTIIDMNNFGLVLTQVSRFKEAEPLFVEAVERGTRVLGESHPSVVAFIGNLGGNYSDQGRVEEAIATYKRALAILSEHHDGNGLQAAGIMNSLAAAYSDSGDFENAKTMSDKVFEIRGRILGEDHPNTVVAKHNLGNLYRKMGKLVEAESMLLASRDAFASVFGEKHPRTLLCRCNLAAVWLEQDRFEEAEPLLRDVLAKANEAIEGHWITELTRGRLGAALTGLKRYEEAEQMLLESYDKLVEIHTASHRNPQQSADHLADLYEAWGRSDDAAEWRAKGTGSNAP